MRTNRKTRTYSVDDLQFKDPEDFRNHIVAQDDDCDYSESGWVAVVRGRYAALAKYSHCSCFGTWTSLGGSGWASAGDGQIVWDWIGTVQGLVKLAKTNGDPHLKGRTADVKDYDYDHLQEVYKGILEWNREQNRNRKPRYRNRNPKLN